MSRTTVLAAAPGNLVALSLAHACAGRPAALGLFAVNAVAVISYRPVLLVLAVFGPGRWAVDQAAIGSGAGRAIA